MSEAEIDAQDADVPELAVAALAAAQRRALESGRPVILMRGCDLVQIHEGSETVLKTFPPAQKVDMRTKQVRP